MNKKLILSIPVLLGLAACGGKPRSEGVVTPSGTISGGGGYADKNALALLAKVSSGLAAELRRSSPTVFTALPTGWDRERLARVAEGIQAKATVNKERDGRALMFDYDEMGGTISALEPFFTAYASIPESKQNDPALVEDLETRLLHETAHLMGRDEGAAEGLAQALLDGMNKDFVLCQAPDAIDASSLYSRPWSVLVHRPTAKIVRIIDIAVSDYGTDGWKWIRSPLEEGRKGEVYKYLSEHAETRATSFSSSASGIAFAFDGFEASAPFVGDGVLSVKSLDGETKHRLVCEFKNPN